MKTDRARTGRILRARGRDRDPRRNGAQHAAGGCGGPPRTLFGRARNGTRTSAYQSRSRSPGGRSWRGRVTGAHWRKRAGVELALGGSTRMALFRYLHDNAFLVFSRAHKQLYAVCLLDLHERLFSGSPSFPAPAQVVHAIYDAMRAHPVERGRRFRGTLAGDATVIAIWCKPMGEQRSRLTFPRHPQRGRAAQPGANERLRLRRKGLRRVVIRPMIKLISGGDVLTRIERYLNQEEARGSTDAKGQTDR